jgi:hypothetical protein
MAKRDKDLAEALLRIATQVNVEGARIGRGTRHPCLIGELEGRTLRYAFAGSTGSQRTYQNTLADFRNYIRAGWPNAATAFAKTAAAGEGRTTRTRSRFSSALADVIQHEKAAPRADHWHGPLEDLRARLIASSESQSSTSETSPRVPTSPSRTLH